MRVTSLMHVLVTGGVGFFGSHLVDSLYDGAVRNRMSLRETDPDPRTSAFAVAQRAMPMHSLRSRSGHTVSHAGT